jgi:hypothetical protein
VKFSELDKEKKQLLILAVGGVITIFFVISNLVIGPAKEQAAQAEETIEELDKKVRDGDRILRRSALAERQVKTLSSEILSIHQSELPPLTSPYIWAVEKLSLLAEELQLKITVREHPANRYLPIPPSLQDFNPDSVPMWIPYTVDVEVNTTFANLKKFLVLLEESLPYASVAELMIQTNQATPEEHDITFMVEWPTFRLEEDLSWMTEQINEGDTP